MKKISLLLLGAFFIQGPLTAQEPSTDIPARLEAIHKVVKHGKASEKTISSYIESLNDNNVPLKIREQIAWALGELNAKKAAPALIKAAQHKGLLIRSAALDALMAIKPSEAVATFQTIAQKDPVLLMRQRATMALTLTPRPDTVLVLSMLANDPSPDIRGAAALAMPVFHSKKNDFSELLADMKKDPDPSVQQRATLSSQSLRKAREAMIEALRSPHSDIRWAAALYFGKNAEKKDAPLLKERLSKEENDTVASLLKSALSLAEKAAPKTAPRQKKNRSQPSRSTKGKG